MHPNISSSRPLCYTGYTLQQAILGRDDTRLPTPLFNGNPEASLPWIVLPLAAEVRQAFAMLFKRDMRSCVGSVSEEMFESSRLNLYPGEEPFRGHDRRR